MKKVNHFLAITLLVNASLAWVEVALAEEKIDIVVNRSPACSCCGKWVEHLRQNNFNVKDVVSDDVQAIKNKYGVTKELASCHTAIVNGYAIEGHVPAGDIKTLLKKKSDIAGITVPGMPSGTPGMEMGGKKDAYQVISFDKKNQQQVFNSYKAE
ncbi:MAG: DUF411 domain-containing protein [Proteobacteria bacterium]|nr:DUF411 domain-containing protein [Pseudomonadota bacterium]